MYFSNFYSVYFNVLVNVIFCKNTQLKNDLYHTAKSCIRQIKIIKVHSSQSKCFYHRFANKFVT